MLRFVLSLKNVLCALLVAVACPALAETVTNLAFTLHWPLREPSATSSTSPPLLRGDVSVKLAEEPSPRALEIVVRMIRPTHEQHRVFWNRALAYPEHNRWMASIRVWDDDQQWLWPNLPYLLRATGVERLDRYGGWDAGKNVDNDFAAVLIRAYDAAGEEWPASSEHPLVSGEWYPGDLAPGAEPHRYTVVHIARSDTFSVPLHAPRGTLKIWLIYADFFGAPVPRSWPKAREFDGGILKFFTVTWSPHPQHGYAVGIAEDIPPESTRFDWKRWYDRPAANAMPDALPRLTFGGIGTQ